MRYRLNLKALGLTLLAALGIMAFSVVGAQANWLYLLGDGKADEFEADEVVQVSVHPGSHALLLVPGKNLEILCKKMQGNDVLLLALKTVAHGAIIFNECMTYFNNFKGHLLRAATCDPVNQPIAAGGLAHLVLHLYEYSKGSFIWKNYVLFEPSTGLSGTFTTLEFSELCALTETAEVTGQLVAECGQLVSGVFALLDCAQHKVTHLLRQAPAALFPEDGLTFGENAATLDGIAAITLAGKLAGSEWGGHI